jgi:outer membrane receptor protein involved in Fe transport
MDRYVFRRIAGLAALLVLANARAETGPPAPAAGPPVVSAPAPDPAAASAPSPAAEPADSVDENLAAEAEVIVVEERAAPSAGAAGLRLAQEELASVAGSRGDALDAARNLPGIANVSGFSGLGGDLVVRGTSGEDSLYLVDGIPLPLALHFGNIQSVLPTQQLEEVEVIPGGFDVEYGRATGGLVQLRTRPPDPERFSAAAELSLLSGSAYVEGPIGRSRKLAFALGVRRSIVDAIVPALLPEDAHIDFMTPPHFSDAQLRLDWRPDGRHRLVLAGFHSRDRMALDVGADNASDPGLTGTIAAESGFWRSAATWEYAGPGLDLRTLFWLGAVRLHEDVGGRHFYDYRPFTAAVRHDLRWRAGRWLILRLGGDAELDRGTVVVDMPLPGSEGNPRRPNFAADPHFTLDQAIEDLRWSGYGAAEIQLGTALSLRAGARADHYGHIDEYTVSPRGSLAWVPADGWLARLSAGLYSRPPSLAEWIPEHLEPERAVQYVASVQRRLGDGIQATASGFATSMRQLVVRDDARIVDSPLDAYRNAGRGRSTGLELLLRARLPRGFAWLAYTLSRATRVDAPGMPERLFDHDQTHNLIAALSWEVGAWRLGGKFQYTSGTPYTPVTGSVYQADMDLYEPTFAAINSERFAAAHRLDLRVDRSWQWRHVRLSAYLDLSNVYGHARTVAYSYSFDYGQRKPVTDMPFLPALGLKGEF